MTSEDHSLARASTGVSAEPGQPGDRKRTPHWAERLVQVLDDGFRVPGTDFRFGIDAIVGMLLPAAGDAITGVGSMGLLTLAVKQRVPTIVLLRMVMNIGIDVIAGAVPLVGDAFDLVWKSNRRNLKLIERYRASPAAEGKRHAHAGDYLVVAFGFLLAILAITVPFVVLFWLGGTVWEWLRALVTAS